MHPAAYVRAKILPTPVTRLEEGVDATFRLVPTIELTGVSRRYLDGQRARADGQAYDRGPPARLAAISRELTDAALGSAIELPRWARPGVRRLRP
jgi:hypothetical protein